MYAASHITTVLTTAGGHALTLVLSLSRTGVHTCVFMDTEMHLHPSCTAVCTKPARSDMTDCCHVNSCGRYCPAWSALDFGP